MHARGSQRRWLAVVLGATLGLLACPQRPQPSRGVPGGDASRGQAQFVRYGCGGCHAVPGLEQAKGRVAAPLENFADRGYVAGVLPNSPEALVRWIVDPQGVNPQTAMPDLGVSEAEARDIAAYLYTLSAPRR